MARIRASAQTTEIALTAATTRTLLQLVAATNVRVAVKGFSISFDGIAGDAQPVVVDVLRQTSAGTMSALTPKADIPITETLQTTAQHSATGTEPTAGDVLRTDNIHPQTGVSFSYAFDEEIIVPGAGRLALRATAPANVNALARFLFEE